MPPARLLLLSLLFLPAAALGADSGISASPPRQTVPVAAAASSPTAEEIDEMRLRGARERKEEILTTALEHARARGELQLVADCLQSRGYLRYQVGDVPGAAADLDEALSVYRILGDRAGTAGVLKRTGDLRQLAGDRKGALLLYMEAAPLFAASGDLVGSANVSRSLGDLRAAEGDRVAARGHYTAALEEYERGGSATGMANALRGLAELDEAAGDHAGALERYARSGALFAEARSPRGEGGIRRAIGDVRAALKDAKGALLAYDEAAGLFERAGDLSGLCTTRLKIAPVLAAQRDAAAADAYAAAVTTCTAAGNPHGAGDASRDLGELHARNENLLSAEVWLRRSAASYGAAGAAVAEGNVRQRLAEILSRGGSNTAALEELDLAAGAFRSAGEKRGEAAVTRQGAAVLAGSGQGEPAAVRYAAAAELYRQAGDRAGEAAALHSSADIHAFAGDRIQSERGYLAADAAYVAAGSGSGSAEVRRSLGELYFRSGEAVRGTEMFNAALALYAAAGNASGSAAVCRSWGDLLLAGGDPAQAERKYDAAMGWYEKSGDRKGVTSVLRSRGDLYFLTGYDGKALEMYGRALAGAETDGDHLGQGNALRSLGEVYLAAGQNARALDHLEKALGHYVAAGSPIGIGSAWRGIAEIRISSGDEKGAEEAYGLAMEEFRRAGVPLGLAMVYRGKGDLLLRRGFAASALELYRKGIAEAQRGGSPVVLGNLYQSCGDAALLVGNFRQAREMYALGLEQFAKAGEQASAAYTLFRMAGLLGRLGNVPEAVAAYEDALRGLENVRRQALFDDMKKAHMSKAHEIYLEAASYMLEKGFERNAFTVVEGMKARLFLDRLAEASVDLDSGIDPELKARRDGLRRRTMLHLRQLAREASEGSVAADSPASAKEAEVIAAETEALEKDIRVRNPLYGSVNYPEPVSATGLQPVLREDEVLVEYFLAPSAVYAFAVTQNAFEVRKLAATPRDLEERVRKYLSKIAARRKVGDEAGVLHEVLLRPFASMFAGKKLLVVPDGILSLLPFETLIDRSSGSERYVLENAAVRYVQSASVLKTLRQHPRHAAPGGFLGVGDPVYDFDGHKRGREEQVAAGGEGLTRLEGSGVEVEEIAEIFQAKGVDARSLLRLDAREDNLKASLGAYRYLHFSTHGLLDARSQSIVMSLVPDSEEDGFLTLGEIMNTRLNARLVVLSACRTGLGASEPGEGVTGLTRGVMYAGSPAAVVTLWSVGDVATKELMVGFYDLMVGKGTDADEALRQAKLSLIRGRGYSHPFFWGGVVMYGE